MRTVNDFTFVGTEEELQRLLSAGEIALGDNAIVLIVKDEADRVAMCKEARAMRVGPKKTKKAKNDGSAAGRE